MSDSLEREARFEAAASLLGVFLQQHGEPAVEDLERLAAQHPECAGELRELWRERGPANLAWDAASREQDAKRRRITDLLAGVREPATFPERYSIEGRLGAGGMGVVYQVRDRKLARTLALKVIRAQAEGSPVAGPREVHPQQLHRFLEEARLTSQLDHPGIVPVHEVGIDDTGRAFFTMKLVRGRDLAEVLRLHHERDPHWSTTRLVGIVQRACEAIAYAHERGVIHRDLKPANIRVGDFGEVFVMDWGLARASAPADGADSADTAADPGQHLPACVQEQPEQEFPAGMERSREGQAIGTPAYMAPEQAQGNRVRVGISSDVYSLGAILYQLLAGFAPYGDREAPLTPELAVFRVMREPPTPLARVAPRAPSELVAICERAMERESSRRYPSATALAADLAAFLERRVVSAYERGAWAELRKWVLRNRVLSISMALLLSTLVVALLYKVRGDRNETLASVTHRIDDVESLIDRADRLWPPVPEMVPELEHWLVDAQRSVSGGDGLPGFEDLRRITLDLAAYRRPYLVESGASSFVGRLLDVLCLIDDPESGLLHGRSLEHGWGIEQRQRLIAATREATLDSPHARERWQAACASLADPTATPRYHGLVIEPQFGLLPLGCNAEGLWEFAYLLTGEEPVPPRGVLATRPEDALVFVLLPGGTFQMGAQAERPDGKNFDPNAQRDESPVTDIELAPFLLSKYELTQAQWLRITAKEPSRYKPGPAGWPITMTNPVEQVSWYDCRTWLDRIGLEIPTEAQWEYAARAETHTIWSTGNVRSELKLVANLADQSLKGQASNWILEDWDDPFSAHAPVGQFAPNGFGLYDMHGNVQEWCRDGHCLYSKVPEYPDGSRGPPLDSPDSRIMRGGSWDSDAINYARSAARTLASPGTAMHQLGVRPALRLQKYLR